MSLISLFMLVFLTSMTGTIVFVFWKIISRRLEKRGKLRVIKGLLIVTICFYLVPVVFACLAYRTGLFGDTKTETLFRSTPVFVILIRIGAVVWIIGFVLEVFKYLCGREKIRAALEKSFSVRESVREVADECRKRLKIFGRVDVRENLGQDMPLIVGLAHCTILLPEKNYKEDELKIILEHELLHYKYGDLILKKLCAWIVRIQWFNPVTRELFSEVDTWGDVMCDLRLCFGEGFRWSLKEYFLTVIENSRKTGKESSFSVMGLRSSGEKLNRRIMRMKEYKKEKDFKGLTVILVTICFALMSSITSLAAGEGVAKAYGDLCDATEVEEVERLLESSGELEEYTWVPGEGLVITQTEENPYTRGLKSYDWKIPGGELYETGTFWATKDSTIAITVNPLPQGARTSAGLHEPSGILRGVTASGAYAHTFTVRETGFHRAYVRNEQALPVQVIFAVSR